MQTWCAIKELERPGIMMTPEKLTAMTYQERKDWIEAFHRDRGETDVIIGD